MKKKFIFLLNIATKIYRKIYKTLDKVFSSDDFYIWSIFLFTLASLIIGEFNNIDQNRIRTIDNYTSNLSDKFHTLDSIFSDSQIANSIFGEQNFSQKAYKEYLSLAFLMGLKIENSTDVKQIKTHKDLEVAVRKDTIHTYRHTLEHLNIDRDLYEESSKIWSKFLQRLQYATALFALFLALNQSKKRRVNKNK